MALVPGTILGQYEIRAPLGAGGMGEVYRAYDTRLDREVAIKVLPESMVNDQERLRRFEQEARAAAALNHPNILAVYQMATHAGGISYLVTELLEGETLRERLVRGPIPLRKAIEYGVQIAHGLAAPHEKGIVHRDLKPENLFLTRDGRIKILDFGLAKAMPAAASFSATTMDNNKETDPKIAVGTVGYMAPEQVRGKPADHRSDIFAFGTVLYELVTSRQTFRKPTSAETLTAILNEDPPPITQFTPAVPPGLHRVVHRCLEKNPEQRFQSASDLAFALEALSDSSITTPSGAHVVERHLSTNLRAAILALFLLVLAISLASYFLLKPPPQPALRNYVQLTHDGAPKDIVGADGSRLYIYKKVADSLEFGPNYQGLWEMSLAGGEPRRLAILPTAHMVPVGLSGNGAELLAIEGQGIPTRGPLWALPILGGSPHRIGDLEAQSASWSADGSLLAYTKGGDLMVANPDGTNSRTVVSLKGNANISLPVWSPDRRYLRFNIFDTLDAPSRLWEVAVDGSNLHQLFPGTTRGPIIECCGIWSSDGNYYLFHVGGQIWASAEKRGFLRRDAKPFQLTSSPLILTSFTFSQDGKKLYVEGRTYRGQLSRYDPKSKQFEPFLGEFSAEYVSFSKDGQWMAYVSFPEGTLWRSRVDGSERLQLTFPPNYAYMPQWSPDGKSIAFYFTPPEGPSSMYTISPDGGNPRQLLPENHPQQDPNWSPDGSKIVFGSNSGDASSTIRILDMTTHEMSILPGSEGLFSPRWSPNGKYIAAFSVDLTKLLLFDFETKKWAEFANGTVGWLSWSHDGQYLYFMNNNGTITVLRLRISDRKIETVVDLKDFPVTGSYGSSMTLAPDDSPLLLRNTGTQDVYALDWVQP